jgi:hypothetical protein
VFQTKLTLYPDGRYDEVDLSNAQVPGTIDYTGRWSNEIFSGVLTLESEKMWMMDSNQKIQKKNVSIYDVSFGRASSPMQNGRTWTVDLIGLRMTEFKEYDSSGYAKVTRADSNSPVASPVEEFVKTSEIGK